MVFQLNLNIFCASFSNGRMCFVCVLRFDCVSVISCLFSILCRINLVGFYTNIRETFPPMILILCRMSWHLKFYSPKLLRIFRSTLLKFVAKFSLLSSAVQQSRRSNFVIFIHETTEASGQMKLLWAALKFIAFTSLETF